MGGTAKRPNNVTDLSLARPFDMAAMRYFNAGWWPLIVPYGKKERPPVGFTGRNAYWPNEEQIAEWNKEGNHNVAFHLGPVPAPRDRGLYNRSEEWTHKEWLDVDGTPLWTVVGIDVDHYSDGEKQKLGGDQLKALEEEHGKLPDTWISSARDDGISGIRYYLSPNKFHYSGQAAKDIEVIQETHRYAMTWPSKHPKGGQYTWFRPGQPPSGQAATSFAHTYLPQASSSEASLKFVQREVVPSVWALPMLPEKWIEHLTSGYMLDEGIDMDMDMSIDDLFDWAMGFKNESGRGEGDQEALLAEHGCKQMKKRVAEMKHTIEEDATSHDKVKDAHWNIIAMGQEGHAGWHAAMMVIENFWVEDVVKRGKRGPGEARREMFRSRTNGLRKIKAQEDAGRRGKGMTCGCYEAPPIEPEDGAGFLAIGNPKDPGEYEQNDDGNGLHFIDVYEDNARYVEGYESWIMWSGDRWSMADKFMTRRAYRVIKERQLNYAQHLWSEAENCFDADEAKVLKKKAAAYEAWALRSGNNAQAGNALEAASANEGVTLASDQINGNESLLGVANGVLVLNARHRVNGVEVEPEVPFTFRPAAKEDFVTIHTDVPYIPLGDQLRAGGDMALGVRLWAEFLETFLPDEELRAWTQQIMGHAIYGKNIAKQLVFLYGLTNTGKSTFLDVVMKALGDYAGPFEMALFDNSGRFNTSLVQSLKRRIITTTEIGSKQGLSPEMMKRMTGNDKMSSEVKNEMSTIEGVPAFVPIFGTNNAPNVDNNDPALQDRVVVLPFDVQMPKSSAGGSVLEYSATAVLAWLVDGWALYVKHDMKNKPGAKLHESEAEFLGEMSGPAGQFLSDCVERTGNHEDIVVVDELYTAYERWAKLQRMEHPWNKAQFGMQITRAGVDPAKATRDPKYAVDGKVTKVRRGIKLQESLNNVASFKMQHEA